MLIDRTYFVGTIEVANANANTTPNPVGSRLDWFIARYEPEFLEKALGLDLYEALKAGYQAPTPDQKWIDLVQGVIYQNAQGKRVRWRGLITQPESVLDAFDVLGRRRVRVGEAGLYNPVPNQSTATIPPEFVGKQFVFHQRGFDDLILGEEYNVSGNVLTLVSAIFSTGDTFTYKAAELAINTSTGSNKESLIANYVYYWYQRYGYTQTTTMGEVRSKTENALTVDSSQKLVTAWNEMHRWYMDMVDYLNTNADLYTEWVKPSCVAFGGVDSIFGTMNELGM